LTFPSFEGIVIDDHPYYKRIILNWQGFIEEFVNGGRFARRGSSKGKPAPAQQ
jgi:hypothetical protein